MTYKCKNGKEKLKKGLHIEHSIISAWKNSTQDRENEEGMKSIRLVEKVGKENQASIP